jgi:hypothetical protein
MTVKLVLLATPKFFLGGYLLAGIFMVPANLAAGQFDSSDCQRQIITVLARIVLAEMDYCAKDAAPG